MWCAQFIDGAGEDIRYVARDEADAAGLPNYDYWLFDSSKLVRMHFDDVDQFHGGEVIVTTGVMPPGTTRSDGTTLPLNSTFGASNVHEARNALDKRRRELLKGLVNICCRAGPHQGEHRITGRDQRA